MAESMGSAVGPNVVEPTLLSSGTKEPDTPEKGHEAVEHEGSDSQNCEANPTSSTWKSDGARQREEARSANFALYEHLSNENLEKLLPRRPDGTCTSIGAMLHASEKCAACSFFHYSMKGCNNGMRCKFCHGDHPKRQRTRNRRRHAAATDDGSRRQNAATVAEDGEMRRTKQRTEKEESKVEAETAIMVAKPADEPALDEAGNSRPSWLRDDSSAGAYGRAWSLPAGPPVGLPVSPHCPYSSAQFGVWSGCSYPGHGCSWMQHPAAHSSPSPISVGHAWPPACS